MPLQEVRVADTPAIAQQNSQIQANSLSKTQAKLSTKTIFKIIAALVLLLIITFIILTVVELTSFRDTYTLYSTSNYTLNDRSIRSTPYSYQHNSFYKPNAQTTGQIITLPKNNPQQSSLTPQLLVLNNNQSGMNLKKINDNNYIIQIEPQKIIAYYQKTHPTQTKRMLAYLHITRTLTQEHHSFASEQLRNKIVELICQKTKMDYTKTIFKEVEYHVATRTDQGYVLQRDQPNHSRLLQSTPSRQLFFYDMYMAYLMAARTSQMIDAAEQIQKAQQKQRQQTGQEGKGKQPVTVVTVINIVNNSNVVINLNSSSNVVINNNNNKQVNIVKGKNQPTINNNTENTNNSNNQARSNINNQIQNNNNQQIQNNNKRILTTQPINQPNTSLSKTDDAISKAVFEYAGLCTDVRQNKYCPVGYFHRADNPFQLAVGEVQKGVDGLKTVRRIVIGSQLLLNIDQLAKQLVTDKN